MLGIAGRGSREGAFHDFYQGLLTKGMLKLLKELPVSTKPPVVVNPMSPPLSTSANPGFIEKVTLTSEPL